jgi:hypothetical protein
VNPSPWEKRNAGINRVKKGLKTVFARTLTRRSMLKASQTAVDGSIDKSDSDGSETCDGTAVKSFAANVGVVSSSVGASDGQCRKNPNEIAIAQDSNRILIKL